MKTFIKIILIFVGIGLISYILLGSWALSTYDFYPSESPVDEKKLESYSFDRELDGDSITQLGFTDGQIMHVFPNKPCNIGDICFFECLSSKCAHPDHSTFFKKAQSINSGCYYFVGNSGKWMKNGVLVESWDSHLYGALCPGDFRILGVVLN